MREIRILAVALGTLVSWGEAPAAGNDLVLAVTLRNDAGPVVSNEVIDEARADVASIYSVHGIRIVWVPKRPQLTLVLLSRKGGERMHQASDAMGYAPASGTGGGRIAYVLQDRVERVAHGHGMQRRVVLAAALAHELGHLLLPSNAHSTTGLMRAKWNQSDFRKMREQTLRFTEDQTRQLHEAVAQLTTPSLTICLRLSPALANDMPVKTAVLSEVARVWRLLGLEIDVRPECDRGCGRPIVVKSAREARAEEVSSANAIAWVPFVEGHAQQLVFVNVDRAHTVVHAFSPAMRLRGLTNLYLAKLLGRSLAHELGHVLLDSPDHELSGLMRARYAADDALRDLASAYTLNAQQHERLWGTSSGCVRN